MSAWSPEATPHLWPSVQPAPQTQTSWTPCWSALTSERQMTWRQMTWRQGQVIHLRCTVQQQQNIKLTCCARRGTRATLSGCLSGCQVPCLPAALHAFQRLLCVQDRHALGLCKLVAALCRVLSLHHTAACTVQHPQPSPPCCCAVQGRQPAKLRRPAHPQSRVRSHRCSRSGAHAWPPLNTPQPPRSGSAPCSHGLPPWPLQPQTINPRPVAPSLLLAAGAGPGGASRCCPTPAQSRWQAAAPGTGLKRQE